MRIIVTRPAAQAVEWVASLRTRGLDAVALPLIGIAPVYDPAPLHAAWRTLDTRRLVVFVSPNAAERFFADASGNVAWPESTLAASPGPGTTQVLRRLGVPAVQIVAPADDAPQFDSESLWAALVGHDWRDASVLIVRGDTGREWLGQTLAAHGARVDALAAYRRTPPSFDMAGRALLAAALEAPAAHLWLFSSSEAIDHLDAACTRQSGAGAWSASRALASHPRIAERARQLGFGEVRHTLPALPAVVVACIESARP